jgi:hypothetical protein
MASSSVSLSRQARTQLRSTLNWRATARSDWPLEAATTASFSSTVKQRFLSPMLVKLWQTCVSHMEWRGKH